MSEPQIDAITMHTSPIHWQSADSIPPPECHRLACVCGECHVDYTKPAEFQQAIRSTASDGHLSVLNRGQVLAMEPSLAHLPLIGGIFDSALNSGSCHLFLQALQTKYAN